MFSVNSKRLETSLFHPVGVLYSFSIKNVFMKERTFLFSYDELKLTN